MAAGWLSSVNWDNIGKAASSVGSAASAISEAASTIKGSSKTSKVTVTESSGGSGDGFIVPLILFVLFKGL